MLTSSLLVIDEAKTIALSQKDNSFFLLKFADDTEIKGAELLAKHQGKQLVFFAEATPEP